MPASAVAAKDLVLLADELEAMVRAGLPLESGLRIASGRWQGRLSASAERLAERLEAGVPLETALTEADDLPFLFRVVVAAGLRTGRTSQVLASYSESTRRMLFLRETLTRGLMYPAILLMLSAILFVMLLMFLWPELARTYDMMRVERPGWFHVAEWLREAIPVWGWVVPVGLVAGVMLLRINSTGPAGWITLLPGGRRIASDMSLANASRLLAILVENDIPFPTALRMTADGVRPAATATAMKQLAGQLELGVPIPSGFRSAAAIPPLWRSLVVAGSNRAELVLGLRQSADIYDHRATNRGEALGNTLPTFLVCVIGGGVTFLYASSLFVPLSQLWNRLGSPL